MGQPSRNLPYRLAVFDLDGTLVRPLSGAKFPKTPYDRTPLAGRREQLADLRAMGMTLAIATNQGGIAYGYSRDEQTYAAIQQLALREFGIHRVYICPHHPQGTVYPFNIDCRCRKPQPGLLQSAMVYSGVEESRTLFVGDRPEDEEAARNAGVDFTWADEYFAAAEKKWPAPAPIVRDDGLTDADIDAATAERDA